MYENVFGTASLVSDTTVLLHRNGKEKEDLCIGNVFTTTSRVATLWKVLRLSIKKELL